jgi:phage baseplate assembly protein W
MSATVLISSREYIDLDNVFTRHPLTNNVAIKKGVNAVKQSIRNLMLLKKGEKRFHPEIYSPIYDLFFENADATMKIVLESETARYLAVYEPRFELSSVKVTFPNPNEISVEISGTVINLQVPITINILAERLR